MDNECTLTKSCPGGYYRKELEGIAHKCGMSDEDIASKNMNKLCEDISRREYFPEAKDLPCNITPRLCKSTKYSRQDIKNVVDRCGIDMSHIPGYHTRPMLCQALSDASLPGAPCRITKVCPGNYRRDELVRIANNCGVAVLNDDGSKKNRGELCVDILDHIDDQANISEKDINFMRDELDLIDFGEDVDEPEIPKIIPPPPPLLRKPVDTPPPLLRKPVDTTPQLLEQLTNFQDVFNIIIETGFICLNDKTWLECTRKIDDYPAAKKAITLLKTTLNNYHPDLGIDATILWNIQSKDGTLKDIMEHTVCIHALGVKLILLYLVWYTKLVQSGVTPYLPDYITQVGDYSMFFTGYISPDVLRPFTDPENNIFNIIYFQTYPVQTYNEAKISVSKDKVTGDEDVVNRNIIQQLTGTPNYWKKLNDVYLIQFDEDEKKETESRVMMEMIQPLAPAIDLFTGLNPSPFEDVIDIQTEELDDEIPLSSLSRPPIVERIVKVEEPSLGITSEDVIKYFKQIPTSPILQPSQPSQPSPDEEYFSEDIVPPSEFGEGDFPETFTFVVGEPSKMQSVYPSPGFEMVPNNYTSSDQSEVVYPSPGFKMVPNNYTPSEQSEVVYPSPGFKMVPNNYTPSEQSEVVYPSPGFKMVPNNYTPSEQSEVVYPSPDDDDILSENSDDSAWIAEIEAAVDPFPTGDDQYFDIQEDQATNAEAIQSIFAAFIAQEGTLEERKIWTEGGYRFMHEKIKEVLAQAKIECNEYKSKADYKNCIFNQINDFYITLFDKIDEDNRWSDSYVGKQQLRELINRLDI